MTRPIYREQCHACGKTTKHYGTISEFWDGLCEPCSHTLSLQHTEDEIRQLEKTRCTERVTEGI